LRKYEKMCWKLVKCAKSWESMRNCAKSWKCVPKTEKVCQKLRKYENVCKKMKKCWCHFQSHGCFLISPLRDLGFRWPHCLKLPIFDVPVMDVNISSCMREMNEKIKRAKSLKNLRSCVMSLQNVCHRTKWMANNYCFHTSCLIMVENHSFVQVIKKNLLVKNNFY